MRHCYRCGKTKKLDNFYSRELLRKSVICKPCQNESSVEWRSRHKGRMRAYMFRFALKKKYGISIDLYLELLKKQNYVCAICHMKCPGRMLAVDHDHNTGAVRGLLCRKCNIGLGNFQDNTDFLLGAVAYLQAATLQTGSHMPYNGAMPPKGRQRRAAWQ